VAGADWRCGQPGPWAEFHSWAGLHRQSRGWAEQHRAEQGWAGLGVSLLPSLFDLVGWSLVHTTHSCKF